MELVLVSAAMFLSVVRFWFEISVVVTASDIAVTADEKFVNEVIGDGNDVDNGQEAGRKLFMKKTNSESEDISYELMTHM